eukprot:Platyproteum_vivax@DN6824_c2_g1_i2.p1
MKWCVWLLVALVGVVGGRLASQPRETTRQVAKTQRRLEARENYYTSLEDALSKAKLGETCLSEDGLEQMKSAISLRTDAMMQQVFVDDWSATVPWEPKQYVLSRGVNGKDQYRAIRSSEEPVFPKQEIVKPSENPDKEKKKKKKKNKGKDKKEGILEGAADAGETSFSEVDTTKPKGQANAEPKVKAKRRAKEKGKKAVEKDANIALLEEGAPVGAATKKKAKKKKKSEEVKEVEIVKASE